MVSHRRCFMTVVGPICGEKSSKSMGCLKSWRSTITDLTNFIVDIDDPWTFSGWSLSSIVLVAFFGTIDDASRVPSKWA
ncbi:hypothetical protein ZOSMA_18G00670 [Zostera marina]|uniref:Uncharacterized protein n=1 Tax=Zostera marina TaxID=29655 RepID=A0A0K9PRX2_ZOSMR|nr:hypothetical protein ZOSMA_18G00670 [Zostera marina]